MLRRSFACLLLTASLLLPAQKPATSKGENQDLVLTVTLYIDPQSINEVIGADLGKDYIVAAVKVEPKAGKEVAVDRADFVLRTDKDGEKVKPFAASQIAGRGALIVTRSGGGGMGIGNAGGYPGGYPPPVYPGSGPPPPIMRPGGISAGTVGEGDTREVSATVRHPARDKENPLEKILKDKALPEKPTREAVSGLLYFGMSKQKMKNLELLYGGRENRISLRIKN
jgi:hypothetical protein